MITLAIEASTYAGSVALFDEERILGEQSVAMRGREHEALMPAVADLLAGPGIEPSRLGRIVCGAGPGAFTSLRIAGGIAKGLALAIGAPLVPVSSLALIVASRPLAPGRYLAALDAMRGDHYVQSYDVDAGGGISAAGPLGLVRSEAVAGTAQDAGTIAIGPSQPDGRATEPHARGVGRLMNMVGAERTADLASWEPAYGRLAEAQVKWEAEHGRSLG